MHGLLFEFFTIYNIIKFWNFSSCSLLCWYIHTVSGNKRWRLTTWQWQKQKYVYDNDEYYNKVKGLKGNCMLINLFEVENFNINFACFSSIRASCESEKAYHVVVSRYVGWCVFYSPSLTFSPQWLLPFLLF